VATRPSDDVERDDSFKRVLVLGKVKDILDLFTLEEPELDLRQIRAASGLPSSTALRLLRNMVSDGLLSQEDGRYRIGLSVLRWAAVARQGLGLIETAMPVLRALRDETGESAGLFVRDGDLRVCVALAESTRAVGRRLVLGHVLPIHAGAPGKTLLAFDADPSRVLAHLDLTALSARTLTDRPSLEKELQRIRNDGFAVSQGEWDLEVSGVAAPVFGSEGQLLAVIGVSAPSTRLTSDRLPVVIKSVRAGAAEISAAHGYLPPRKADRR
jgi:DNA-binding IclR family transcriptional regulator